MGRLAGGILAATFIGGAASTYLFHRPDLNKAGFKLLGLGGLQGTVAQVAALGLAFIIAVGVEKKNSGTPDEKVKKANVALHCTYLLSYIAVPLAAKYFTTRMGTPTEAFVNFAVSGVLGLIALHCLD